TTSSRSTTAVGYNFIRIDQHVHDVHAPVARGALRARLRRSDFTRRNAVEEIGRQGTRDAQRTSFGVRLGAIGARDRRQHRQWRLSTRTEWRVDVRAVRLATHRLGATHRREPSYEPYDEPEGREAVHPMLALAVHLFTPSWIPSG